ncbi:MAG: DUF1992 domain-containing protein [Armatimonadota bacterium]|nr:DUF1992 domain-containing protein [Armatimonadota bacterium]
MAAADDFGENPDWTAGIAERKIQDAIEEGLFDNLPGAGQPLDLSVNPFEPPGMGAINRLLKHNRVLPPWLMLEKEIEASRAVALASLARWEKSEPNLRERADYARLREQARETYHQRLRETNDLILKYNFSNPFAFRAPIPLMIRARLREFDARYGTGDKRPA